MGNLSKKMYGMKICYSTRSIYFRAIMCKGIFASMEYTHVFWVFQYFGSSQCIPRSKFRPTLGRTGGNKNVEQKDLTERKKCTDKYNTKLFPTKTAYFCGEQRKSGGNKNIRTCSWGGVGVVLALEVQWGMKLSRQGRRCRDRSMKQRGQRPTKRLGNSMCSKQLQRVGLRSNSLYPFVKSEEGKGCWCWHA